MSYKAMLFKLLGVAVILGVVVPLLMRGPDGQPIMSLDDWIPDTRNMSNGAEDMADAAQGAFNDVRSVLPMTDGQSADESLGVVSQGDTIYRWQDDNGVWHFSESKDSEIAEALQVRDSDLVVPADNLQRPLSIPGMPAPAPESKGFRGIIGQRGDSAGLSADGANYGELNKLLQDLAKRFGRGEMRDMSEADQ